MTNLAIPPPTQLEGVFRYRLLSPCFFMFFFWIVCFCAHTPSKKELAAALTKLWIPKGQGPTLFGQSFTSFSAIAHSIGSLQFAVYLGMWCPMNLNMKY